MALTVTPGAADADSYGTLAGALAYHTARGTTTWTGDDADLEAALRRGTLAIEWLYGTKFSGIPTNGRNQSRMWPRIGVVDVNGSSVPSDTIPVEIEQATYEAALRELVSAGSLSQDFTSTSGGSIKSETIGDISITYADPVTAGSSSQRYPAIDGVLAPLLGATSGQRRIFRS